MKSLIKVLMAMMVLAIFTVGCVSAEDVNTIDVPTEEINVDDAVVDVVENQEIELEESSESESVGTVYNITNDTTIQDIQDILDRNTENCILNFSYGNYSNFKLNLTNGNNVTFNGNGATLIGTGVNDIFAVDNSTNLVFKNFIININNVDQHGFYGANVTDSVFDNLEIYNGKDGINIKEFQRNLTITNNYIHDMDRDGISIVDHMDYTDDELSNLDSTLIAYNRIEGLKVGIFVGGTFKGNVQYNNITNFTENGIEFDGKPIGTYRNVIGTIKNNIISNGINGIAFINETFSGLTINSNTISQVTTGIYAENITSAANNLVISSNRITGASTGMSFIGQTGNNDFSANMVSNVITQVSTGISFQNINVISVVIMGCTISTNDPSSNYLIYLINSTNDSGYSISFNTFYGCIDGNFADSIADFSLNFGTINKVYN